MLDVTVFGGSHFVWVRRPAGLSMSFFCVTVEGFYKRFVFDIGMNNSGGNMIMTNSNMNTISGMAGGGLVVSSAANKPLTNATNMMAPGQQHLAGNHVVPQVINYL